MFDAAPADVPASLRGPIGPTLGAEGTGVCRVFRS
jgi:hypothetical protein